MIYKFKNIMEGRGFRDEHLVARPAETVATGGAKKKASFEMQHGYWMVPVLTDDHAALRCVLRAAGFDAMSHDRLQTVADGHTRTPGAQRLADAVCLAFDPSMPLAELRREGELTARLLGGQVDCRARDSV